MGDVPDQPHPLNPDEPNWEGVAERECGEHRTTGGRAWCFDCSEWCSDAVTCKGCELPGLRATVETQAIQLADMTAACQKLLYPHNFDGLYAYANAREMLRDLLSAPARLPAVTAERDALAAELADLRDHTEGADRDAELAAIVRQGVRSVDVGARFGWTTWIDGKSYLISVEPSALAASSPGTEREA